uniref:Plant heme peroxidase family profile domain-containing protein n=1 Tax=Zea mays TaxID=4577 RepID=B6U210_MAIZE|nr:hypothetical protein [Zea mays]
MEKRRRGSGGVPSLAVAVLAALLAAASMPSPPRVAAALSPDYYKDSCPGLESIVRYEVARKKNETVVTIPATLRLVFHDCMVGVSEILPLPLGRAYYSCPPLPNLLPPHRTALVRCSCSPLLAPRCAIPTLLLIYCYRI